MKTRFVRGPALLVFLISLSPLSAMAQSTAPEVTTETPGLQSPAPADNVQRPQTGGTVTAPPSVTFEPGKDATFSSSTVDQILCSWGCRNPASTMARAASVAYPRPQSGSSSR